MDEQAKGLTSHLGPIQIDWPRSIGYYGGIVVASSLGFIELPVALFLADIPFFKMLNRPRASRPTRFIAQILDGAAKPVGGDSSATIELTTQNVSIGHSSPSIWQEARQLADHMRDES